MRFRDLPLIGKVSTAPVPAIVGLFMLALATSLMLDGVRQDTERLNGEAFARLVETETLNGLVSEAHTQMYAALSYAANADDAKGLDKRVVALTTTLDGLSGGKDAAASAVQAPLVEYLNSVRETLEMLKIDTATALLLMSNADAKYEKLKVDLGGLRSRVNVDRNHFYSELEDGISSKRTLIVLSVLVLAIAAGGAATAVAVAIRRPVRDLTSTMERLAAGDLTVVVPGAERGDELGAMARAVEVFKRNGVEAARLANESAGERAARERRAETVDVLIRNFDAVVVDILDNVSSAATTLDKTAASMAEIAEQTNRQASASSEAAEHTSSNVQNVAAASEEMTATIHEISSRVARSSSIATQAVKQADATDATVRSLSESAREIGDVVELINSIAGQTNLLALNATIEAARAGEAGKGFAVVASEVKSLANQTAKATGDIAAQVATMRRATDGAVAAIHDIGLTIVSINEMTTSIAGAVEEQSVSTKEVARNVHEAASATERVSEAVHQVRFAAGRAGGAATEVLSSAEGLATQSERLRREVERFLSAMRAA